LTSTPGTGFARKPELSLTDIQALIVQRRERAQLAGQWAPIATWLFEKHGISIDVRTVELLYISSLHLGTAAASTQETERSERAPGAVL
jgi:hypothetical protein